MVNGDPLAQVRARQLAQAQFGAQQREQERILEERRIEAERVAKIESARLEEEFEKRRRIAIRRKRIVGGRAEALEELEREKALAEARELDVPFSEEGVSAAITPADIEGALQAGIIQASALPVRRTFEAFETEFEKGLPGERKVVSVLPPFSFGERRPVEVEIPSRREQVKGLRVTGQKGLRAAAMIVPGTVALIGTTLVGQEPKEVPLISKERRGGIIPFGVRRVAEIKRGVPLETVVERAAVPLTAFGAVTFEALGGIERSFSEDPFETSIELAGTGALFGVLGRGVPKAPKTKPKVDLPEGVIRFPKRPIRPPELRRPIFAEDVGLPAPKGFRLIETGRPGAISKPIEIPRGVKPAAREFEFLTGTEPIISDPFRLRRAPKKVARPRLERVPRARAGVEFAQDFGKGFEITTRIKRGVRGLEKELTQQELRGVLERAPTKALSERLGLKKGETILRREIIEERFGERAPTKTQISMRAKELGARVIIKRTRFGIDIFFVGKPKIITPRKVGRIKTFKDIIKESEKPKDGFIETITSEGLSVLQKQKVDTKVKQQLQQAQRQAEVLRQKLNQKVKQKVQQEQKLVSEQGQLQAFKQQFRQAQTTKQKQRFAILVRQKQKQVQKSKQMLVTFKQQEQKFREKVASLSLQEQKFVQASESAFAPVSISAVGFESIFAEDVAQLRDVRQIPRQALATKAIQVDPLRLALAFPKRKPETFLPAGFNSWQVQLKRKGKFKKVGKPTSRRRALDFGSELADTTSAATFKITPSKKKPKRNPGVIPGYFSSNRFKFRDHRISKGKKIPLMNSFIERRKHRIDSKGEKKGITLKGILASKAKAAKRRRKTEGLALRLF